tara:strand:- start:300 stop:407 length:108 start_codon:yes stop_codon:yes gene_type:complete
MLGIRDSMLRSTYSDFISGFEVDTIGTFNETENNC